MKKTFVFVLVFVFLSMLTIAQTKKQIPPGTIKVEENLFLDITEISNASWMEYRNWLLKKFGENSQEYLSSALDTNVWRDKLRYNEPYVKYYHSHPAYKEYPAVGMSYEQAVAFCKWRSDRVNELYFVKENKLKLHPDSNYVFPEKVKYRLPTKAEWEKYAVVGMDIKTLLKAKKQNHELYNYLREEALKETTKSMDVTAPVKSYYPDKNGIYNILGNVAEMVQEKGIAKGGSYIHKIEEINPQKDFMYDAPKSYIGFRCVAEYVN